MPETKNDGKPRLNGTTLIHGDAAVNGHKDEIAPPISVTATFKAAPNDSLGDGGSYWNPKAHVYSRYTRDTTTRVEHILSAVNRGHAITYGSGLSAGYAALVHFKPKRIAIRGGYMGFHETIATYNKSRDTPVVLFDIDEEFREGDLCWIESPINPRGESKDIKYYAEKIHKVGGVLAVDSTFGPPPLQFPLDLGADCVLHSATKYFGGHSDLLCGILVVKTRELWDELQHTRTYLGSIPGSLESWLLLRSLRTLHLRVPRQSETATRIVQWLNALAKTPAGAEFDGVPGGLLTTVFHSSVQGVDERGFDAGKQMTGGWNPTFSILLATPDLAKRLPFALKYFVAATSLGGVESLVEYRLRADPKEHPCLVRLSIGVEEYEDLKDDLKQGLLALVAKAKL